MKPLADIVPTPPQRVVRPAATVRSRGWVLKRAAIGVLLITLFAVGGSALMYASIEPDQPTTAGE